MKAIVYKQYGSPEVLQLREVEKPVPKKNEVLIKVHAASVNSWDWDLLTGKPYIYRLLFGLFKPKFSILGCDISGVVETIGEGVTQFSIGDQVFGDISDRWGGFAEYVCVHEQSATLKPAAMSFEQAASIPQAAILALQALQEGKKIQKGDKVLINGAGGGVGTFAIQMAKSLGAEVTAVDHTDKLELLQTLGADHVIDYTKDVYTKNGKQYDLIIDVTARRSVFDYKRSLLPAGRFVMIGGSISSLLQAGFLGALVTIGGAKKIHILMHKPNKDIRTINEFFLTGKLLPVIDATYALKDVSKALQRVGDGHAKGKVIIKITHP